MFDLMLLGLVRCFNAGKLLSFSSKLLAVCTDAAGYHEADGFVAGRRGIGSLQANSFNNKAFKPCRFHDSDLIRHAAAHYSPCITACAG